MKRIYQTTLFLFFILNFDYLKAQETPLCQTVRGTVIEAFTKLPLPGAAINVLNSDPNIGTTTDLYGDFVLHNIPIGRISLRISYVGYQSRIVSNVEVLPSKETVLTIKLEEQAMLLEEIQVTDGTKKNEALNDLTTVSARTFLVEETSKYAGSLGDPARMASNYAGVSAVNDSRNDIIIRGNSPYGLLWRVDGIDIPNPNHYALPESKGGAMSMLNNNNLANSDFITGAFPATYGNALSGVFDLNLRNGNTFKREHVFQLGITGFELGTEGPIGKNNASSYIINYRYGAPEVFDVVGLWDEPYLPKYQDFVFKVNMPSSKFGYFQFFGLGGANSIVQDSRKIDSTEWSYGLDGNVMNMDNKMGVFGLSNTYFFNEKTNLVTSVSYQKIDNMVKIDSVVSDTFSLFKSRVKSNEDAGIFAMLLKSKISTRNYLSLGADYRLRCTNYTIYEQFYNGQNSSNRLKIDELTGEFSAYSDIRYHFSNQLSLTAGMRYFHFLQNNTSNLEPRAGLKYQIAKDKSLSFGYGIHSQKQNNIVYFLETYDPETNRYIRTNENLEMTKSQHFIVGYNQMASEHLNLKIETYFQNLWDVPVTAKTPQYSLLNSGGSYSLPDADSLVNLGTGTNYGLELTLEKYLSNNYYFLLTGSLFQSKYKGYDLIERNTEFNGNFAFNALVGYDLKVNDKYIVGINVRGIFAGGRRKLPIDLDASIEKGETVYNWDQAYINRYPDYSRLDVRISLKEYYKKITTEFAVDVTNIFDNQNNIIGTYYNNTTKALSNDFQEERAFNFLFKVYF